MGKETHYAVSRVLKDTVMAQPIKLRAVLGDHPHVAALKSGKISSDLVELEFEKFSPTNRAFQPMVRELKFDVCEMAIVTFLMAKAYNKPLALLPAVMLGRFQQSLAIYNAERQKLTPSDLEGRRVGIRSFTTTTGAWLRGILANDHGVNLDKVRWVTFEEPHVAEYHDTTERAPAGKKIVQMLLDGELDAVIGDKSDDPRVKPLFADPTAAAKAWHEKHGVVPVNHLVVVKESLLRSNPAAVEEVYRMLKQSKQAAPASSGPDFQPFGIEPNRKSLALIIDYAAQQGLIPRRFSVDELFDDVVRRMD
jgi:4,5-dihydroxyphthalate decarboxylase